jgi:hypothetical protein
VTDAAGEAVTAGQIDMESVYAGLETVVEVALLQPLANGEYMVALALEDEATGATASAEALPMTVEIAEEEIAGPEIAAIEIVPTMNDAGQVQTAQVTVRIVNTGPQIDTANVVLGIARDGEVVEEYPLAQNVKIVPGDNEFAQRYIPPTGFEAGTWEFTAILQGIDPNNGEAVELTTSEEPVALEAK